MELHTFISKAITPHKLLAISAPAPLLMEWFTAILEAQVTLVTGSKLTPDIPQKVLYDLNTWLESDITAATLLELELNSWKLGLTAGRGGASRTDASVTEGEACCH